MLLRTMLLVFFIAASLVINASAGATKLDDTSIRLAVERYLHHLSDCQKTTAFSPAEDCQLEERLQQDNLEDIST